jgi:hypothetical protein
MIHYQHGKLYIVLKLFPGRALWYLSSGLSFALSPYVVAGRAWRSIKPFLAKRLTQHSIKLAKCRCVPAKPLEPVLAGL